MMIILQRNRDLVKKKAGQDTCFALIQEIYQDVQNRNR